MKLTNMQTLNETIYQFNNHQMAFIEQRLRKFDLNQFQARTLIFVAENEGTIQKDLAAYLGKQKATVTNILKTLEHKHLLYREIPPENERQKQLFLTAEGKSQVAKVRKAFLELEKSLTDFLSKEQELKLVQILQGLDHVFWEKNTKDKDS